MREVPDLWRQAAARPLVDQGGLPPRHARRAVLRTVQTMRQALHCFDATRDRLGERAWLDPAGGEHRRQLYLRDPQAPEWLACQPFLEHAWRSGIGQATLGCVRVVDGLGQVGHGWLREVVTERDPAPTGEAGSSAGEGWDAGGLHAGAAWHVVRMRRS